jgi:hypothetical protein
MMAVKFGGQNLLVLTAAQGWYELDNIDLTGVNAIVLTVGWQEAPKVAYNFDVRLDAPDGEILGKGTLAVQAPGTPGAGIVIPLTNKPGGKNKLVITGAVEEGKTPAMVAVVNTTFN